MHFNPLAWDSIFESTGSYAYGLNLPMAGDMKPGQLMTRPEMLDMIVRDDRGKTISREDLESKLHRDGLQTWDMLPSEGHVIAFFTRAARRNNMPELLCVRRDSNGQWSFRPNAEKNKCGQPYLPRQSFDEAGKKLITDILKADLGPYNKFLCFGWIPYKGIPYYKRLTLSDKELRPFSRAVPAETKIARGFTAC